jgi:hypothetical protein
VRLLLAVASLLVAAAPAVAASPEPRAIVLRAGEVPPGYVIDSAQSHVLPNAELTTPSTLPAVVARSGRVTGYRRLFRFRGSRDMVIVSGVDVFRRPAGAQVMLEWLDARQRSLSGGSGGFDLQRERVGVGQTGWVFWKGAPDSYSLVLWRRGRLVGMVSSFGLGRAPTIELARKQERRMLAAQR